MKSRRRGNRKLERVEPGEASAAKKERRVRWPGKYTLYMLGLHLLMVVVAGSVVAGFFVGGRALSDWLRTSESFSVLRIEIEGHEKLTEDEVLEAAGIERGMSIFELDEEAARTGIENHPWVREATVTRHMPDGVGIEVTERQIEALLWVDGLWRVDSDGTVFEEHPPGSPLDLVIITGIEESWIDGDRERARTEIRKVLQILGEYERMGLGHLAPVSTVHREHGGGIVLYIGEEAREIRLGSGHTRKKLRRLRAVLRHMARDDLEWEYIMVDSKNFPERVVVRLRST